jgi:hypothetical protein
MGYHDRDLFQTTTNWNSPDKTKQETKNPRMQIISPQKKLHDIQQIINSLPEDPLSMYELQEAIQKILDGE